MSRLIVVSLLALVATIIISPGCGCGDQSVCGSGNTVAPSVVVIDTSVGSTPTPTGGCIQQTAAFTCTPGARLFESILSDTQKGVPPSDEPIYVQALVAALNKRADVCAISGPPLAPDEIAIKARNSNAISATWDVVRADGAIQAIPAAPNNVCIPSRF